MGIVFMPVTQLYIWMFDLKYNAVIITLNDDCSRRKDVCACGCVYNFCHQNYSCITLENKIIKIIDK